MLWANTLCGWYSSSYSSPLLSSSPQLLAPEALARFSLSLSVDQFNFSPLHIIIIIKLNWLHNQLLEPCAAATDCGPGLYCGNCPELGKNQPVCTRGQAIIPTSIVSSDPNHLLCNSVFFILFKIQMLFLSFLINLGWYSFFAVVIGVFVVTISWNWCFFGGADQWIALQ